MSDDAPDWTDGEDYPRTALAERPSNGDGHHQAEEEPEPDAGPISAAKLMAANPRLRPPVIDKLLRAGEVMNLVAAPKMRKSYLVLDLALSVVTGRAWLGMFDVAPGPVLLIDNELHRETLAHRLAAVASGRGITQREYGDRLHIHTLRGRFCAGGLASLLKPIRPGDYSIVIIDTMYRAMPADAEKDPGVMTGFYNTLDAEALRLGSAIVGIHHTSKGLQGGKSVTDTGSGSGVQSRAVDTHGVMREHTAKDAAVLEAVLRSWAPLDPLPLRWTYPCWDPAPDLDAEDIKRESRGGRPRKQASEKPAKEPRREWTAKEFAAQFITPEPKAKDLIIAKAVAAGVGKADAHRLLLLAEEHGNAHRHRLKGSNVACFANRPPDLLDAMAVERSKPMKRSEAKEAVAKLAQLFPVQLNTEQAKFLREQFAQFPAAAVDRAIRAHRAARDSDDPIDFAQLLEECRDAKNSVCVCVPPHTP